MTSLRQIEANQRNARNSTGPRTEMGKNRSRRNGVRHGLTAETVIGTIENAEDYKRFEAAVTADFNPESAVERELVLRLINLLWRLRRAALIESGMLQASTEIVTEGGQTIEPERAFAEAGTRIATSRLSASSEPNFNETINHQTDLGPCHNDLDLTGNPGDGKGMLSHLAKRFLRLAAMDNGAFDRLSRYETALWRQVCQAVFMLEVLRRQSLNMKWLPRSFRPVGGSTTSSTLPDFDTFHSRLPRSPFRR
jgi:hypothetical protein